MTSPTVPTPSRSQLEHAFVATDFSVGGSQAVARSGRLPLAAGGRVSLLHVLPDGLPLKTRAAAEKAARPQLAHAVAALRHSFASRGRADIEVDSELSRGQAYVEIIRHARSAGADLIVIGRHGRRPLKDLLIGSTAERVVHVGDLPVLVVNHKAARAYRRLLLGLDLEDTSRSVVDVALRVLGPDFTAATIVHAYRMPFGGFIALGASPRDITEIRKECRQAAASALSRFQTSLGTRGVRWRTCIRQGDPRAVLLREAETRRADLLAVGTHGRSGLSHTLLGSVAEWVIRVAACDVLVARHARVSFELP